MMTFHSLVILDWLLLFALAFRTGNALAARCGPFNGQFIPDGIGVKENSPGRGRSVAGRQPMVALPLGPVGLVCKPHESFV
jgi:hypothetical protein